MSKKSLILVFILWASFHLSAQTLSIEDRLRNLPDVTFEKINYSNSSVDAYKLKIKQPIDHSDLKKGFFFQKVCLNHRSFDSPTVLVTQGYHDSQNIESEVTKLLNANQINVEHRFFGQSKPDSLNYKYLNLKQVTSDLHHVRELFDKIYSKKWISTGISKGGSTAIFYKYFYPNDVDVSIPYVAPLANSFEDKRFYRFLDSIGTKICREKIKKLQLRLLKNREKVMPLLKSYSLRVGLDYTYLSFGEAFEFSILEYPVAFWQWGLNCNEIPTEESSLEIAVEYFLKARPLNPFGDTFMKRYAPHYYQAATEMGYYGYEIKDFKDLLVSLPIDTNPHATFPPNKMTVNFNGELLKKVSHWMQSKGNNFIFIYGENDPWTSLAVPENDTIDAEWFIMEGKHHGNARIENMNDSNYKRVCSTLERWLNIKIENTLPKNR